MTQGDFPALYQSADDLAKTFQRSFYRALQLYLLALVLAAAISVLGSATSFGAILQVLALLLALSLSVFLAAAKPDRSWYAARAVAESIKTATWRFVCRAEPFTGTTEQARSHFASVLRSIVEQNRQIAKRFTTFLDGVQVSNAMIAMRDAGLRERIDAYLKWRVLDQMTWYAQKAAFNGKMAKVFFGSIILANAIGICLAVIRVQYVSLSAGMPDVFIVLAACLLAWLQAKRFTEHSASYALAAHEIGLVREQANALQAEDQFSHFVGDAENAFSREHTQWIARKDE